MGQLERNIGGCLIYKKMPLQAIIAVQLMLSIIKVTPRSLVLLTLIIMRALMTELAEPVN